MTNVLDKGYFFMKRIMLYNSTNNNTYEHYNDENVRKFIFATFVLVLCFFGVIIIIIVISLIKASQQHQVPKKNLRIKSQENNRWLYLDLIDLKRLSQVELQTPSDFEAGIPSGVPILNVRDMRFIGAGHFGLVFKGTCEFRINSSARKMKIVAVKIPQDFVNSSGRSNYDAEKFMSEIDLHYNLSPHDNVTTCYGRIVIKGISGIVLEYCANGMLKNFLHKLYRTAHSKLSLHEARIVSDLNFKCIKFSRDIAAGMAHISQHKIVHRDLAARNILMGASNTCKISDFGFACIYPCDDNYLNSDEPKPVRWLSPESLFGNNFTDKSDVWSFGILLWEIITLGATPYHDLKLAVDVIQALSRGYRMTPPDHCSADLYEIMKMCWQTEPNDRPNFDALEEIFTKFLETAGHYVNFRNFQRNFCVNQTPTIYRESILIGETEF